MSRDTTKPTPKPNAGSGKGPRPATPSGRAEKDGSRAIRREGQCGVGVVDQATGAFGREVSTERLQKLENPGLSLADDAPTPFDYVKPNPQGTVKGYNPYDSGRLGKGEAPRKKDLKKLSEWVKLKKQAAPGGRDEE